MGCWKIIALVFGGLAVAAAVEAKFGSTHYNLNGGVYAVPHKYEFMRQFRLPWLEAVKGLDKEPDESIWLLIPASELARDVPGYSRKFHGYSTDVEADMVVNVLAGKEAREFAQDRAAQLQMVGDALASGEGRERDRATGWTRIYSMQGIEGTPGEGDSHFYLLPEGGPSKLPTEWRPPSCQGSPDLNGRERYDCSYVILRNGLAFDFTLRQENLGVASRIPDYVIARLTKWRN